MSDQWDSGCEDVGAGAAKCELRIVQLAQSAREIVNVIASPVDDALAALEKAAKQLGRRLLRGATQDIDALEAQAGWLTNVLLDPIDAKLTSLESMRTVCDAQGACVTSPAPQPDPESPAPTPSIVAQARYIEAPQQAQQPHDVDQANILILADPNEPWHQRLRAWYGGALDSVLLAPSITAAVAARTEQMRQDRQDNYAAYSLSAANSPD